VPTIQEAPTTVAPVAPAAPIPQEEPATTVPAPSTSNPGDEDGDEHDDHGDEHHDHGDEHDGDATNTPPTTDEHDDD
jgi:hypothetical protein